MASKRDSYEEWMKSEYTAQIDGLDLSDQQKAYLRNRWLDQMIWLSSRSNEARDKYYAVKVTTILAGVLVPVLVGSDFGDTISPYLKMTAIALGIIIAASNGLNEFFKYGDRWRNYRSSSEMLKAEWWSFYSLTGRYTSKLHARVFDKFAEQAENIIRLDLKTYISEVSKEQKPQEEQEAENKANG